MRRILIIAYYFPPIGGIGSIRMARFATYLPELGWEPTIIAPKRTPHAIDPYLQFPEEKVARSRSIELSRLGRAIPSGGGGTDPVAPEATTHRARAAVRRAAYRSVFYPDAQVGWYPGAVAKGLRLLSRERFDAIYSSSNPITAHLVARTLSRRGRLPWVAEFRDPWSDRLPEDHPHRSRAARLEAAIAEAATRVVVPTPTLAEFWGRRWEQEIAVIPNGHDLARPSEERPEYPVLTHVGTYYPEHQSFRALWTALKEIARTGRRELPRLRFVGELPEVLRRELDAAGLSSLVEVTGFLPLEDAMRAMSSSTMLIASGFAGDDPVSRGVIPAKLFEYLASGLPILYLGSPADDAGDLLLGQPGCYVVEPTDVAGVEAALEAGLSGSVHNRDAEQFSRRARTRALARLLDQAVEISAR